MQHKKLESQNAHDSWLVKPLKKLTPRTLRTAHPHWSDSELNQAILMLDLKQKKPYGDLGVILT